MSDSQPQPKADPHTKSILVVEDEPEVREMIQLMLQAEGFRTAGSRDAKNIITKAINSKASLIVSDVMMPGGGGYEVLRMLQSDPETRNIPVIIITGASFDKSTRQMMESEPNVKEFMDKPLKPVLFVMRVHQILNTITKEEKMIADKKKQIQGSLGDIDQEII